MWRRSRSLLLRTAVVLSACAATGAAQMSDRDLAQRISQTISAYPHYTVFDSIEIQVTDRSVLLAGRVTTPKKRDEIEARVRKIDGIRDVTNEIGVLPVSPADDELRYRIAHAIYGHPMFWVYAQMPVPPIHIVVERGRITLTGAADSEVQKSMAATLAQVGGTLGVTNRIRVDRR
ncbi:MAG: BON domain-containing protein [Acidobacteria bacterium]|nr:BON domain-containing protein [Acidobacteriota bacterium]